MSNEALEIRQEIERLKAKLRGLSEDCLKDEDPLFVCTSSFCGHDDILDNLRGWCKQMDANSRCVVAGYQGKTDSKNQTWYSTTIDPSELPKLTKDKSDVVNFYNEIISLEGLTILELLSSCSYNKEDLIKTLNIESKPFESTIKNLLNNNLIAIETNKVLLTGEGWQMYCVLGHLYHNHRGKAPVEKAIFLTNLIREKLNIELGCTVNSSVDEFTQILDDNNMLNIAKKEKITDREINLILTGYYRFKS